MAKKIRISKKLDSMFSKQLADRIRQIGADYHIKSFTFQTVPYGKKFYVGEGESYYGIHPDGQEASFQVVSQNTIGASGVSHAIGSEFKMPCGSILIRVSYYTKYWMDIYYTPWPHLDHANPHGSIDTSAL